MEECITWCHALSWDLPVPVPSPGSCDPIQVTAPSVVGDTLRVPGADFPVRSLVLQSQLTLPSLTRSAKEPLQLFATRLGRYVDTIKQNGRY